MKNIRSFVMGFLCAVLIITLATGVFAVAVRGTLTTAGPSVKVDGTYVVFGSGTFTLGDGCEAPSSLSYRDEKGGGTTYLPIRKVCEALGVSIDWDSETNTVLITSSASNNQAANNSDNIQNKNDSNTSYDLSTTDGMADYINQEMGTISTPFGDFKAKVTISENTSSMFPQDYEVRTECYFPWYDLKYSIKYTDEQKEEAISKLRSYQVDVYDLVSQYLPDKKLMGGYYLGYYKYPNTKVGYEATRVFYWRNFTDGITVTYPDTSITYFHFYNVFDDYVFE